MLAGALLAPCTLPRWPLHREAPCVWLLLQNVHTYNRVPSVCPLRAPRQPVRQATCCPPLWPPCAPARTLVTARGYPAAFMRACAPACCPAVAHRQPPLPPPPPAARMHAAAACATSVAAAAPQRLRLSFRRRAAAMAAAAGSNGNSSSGGGQGLPEPTPEEMAEAQAALQDFLHGLGAGGRTQRPAGAPGAGRQRQCAGRAGLAGLVLGAACRGLA